MAAEAKEHEKKAEKALSTSWMSFKMSPDYMLAGMEYAQAATKYRVAGMLADSVRTHVKSAELKEKEHDLFGAGRAYEQACTICEGKPEAGDAEALLTPAIRCYRLSGKGEQAAKLILKLATFQEKRGNLAKAKEAYDDAIEVFEADEKDFQLGDVYKQFIAFLVRAEMFEEALVAMDGHIKVLLRQGYHPFAHKEMLGKCVICLWLGDTVRAEESVNSSSDVKDWFTSKEAGAAFELVAAFQAYDSEAAAKVLKEQVFTFLQVEVARIAKKLHIPTVASASTAAPLPVLTAPKAQPSSGYTAAPAPALPEDSAQRLAEAPASKPGSEDCVRDEPAADPEPANNLGELLM